MNTPMITIRIDPKMLHLFRRKLEAVAPSVSVSSAVRGFMYWIIGLSDEDARDVVLDGQHRIISGLEKLEEADVTGLIRPRWGG